MTSSRNFGEHFRMAVPHIGDPTGDCCAMDKTVPGEHRLSSFVFVEALTGILVGLKASTISAYVVEML